MNTQPDLALGLSPHLTHKANFKHTRYGWLRLTPAYSVHLVSDILRTHRGERPVVLDPFCGTGTTALVCAENGVASETTDINPFLLWLTRTKTRHYSREEVADFGQGALRVAEAIRASDRPTSWVPPLHQIEKWWDEPTLGALSRAMAAINNPAHGHSEPGTDLLKIAFCRVMIERSNASFGHQSMSFKKHGAVSPASEHGAENGVAESWIQAVAAIGEAATSRVSSPPRVFLCDSRDLTQQLPSERYTCVITSPPYPNRMSYIRELRPYMYWLGYLATGRDAGEMDWKAIGGTWGCATSNLGRWKPQPGARVPHAGFYEIVEAIAQTSPLLSRYVHKYFDDMVSHTAGLFEVMKPGGDIHYIVGNSKFYGVMLPVQEIFASLFRASGFHEVEIHTLRKRTSKKELFEYRVSASKPRKATLRKSHCGELSFGPAWGCSDQSTHIP